jgi:hypothetical protein
MATFSRIFQARCFLLVFCIAPFSQFRAAFAQNSYAGENALPADSDAQKSFNALKGLGGTWTGHVTTDPPNPDLDGPIQVTMRLGSAGNVVIHEIAPGGAPEPTMIYVEDGRLTLVHYCEAGNRPRLVARRSTDPNSVDFYFVDISGSRSPVYLERFVFTIIDPNHHTEDWTFMLPENKLLHAHFDLRRAARSNLPTTQP